MKFTPCNKQLLVKKMTGTETQIIGSMYIPDMAKDKLSTSKAEVVRISPPSKDFESQFQVGDIIFIRNWSGNEMVIDGVEHALISEFEVLGYWRE